MKYKLLIICLIAISVFFVAYAVQSIIYDRIEIDNDNIADVDIKDSLHSISIPFIQNMGQVDSDVKYYVDTFAGRVFVTDDSIAYVIQSENNTSYMIQEHPQKTSFSITPLNKTNTNVSSFIGNYPENWQSTIPTYDGLNLGELWGGIDVSLHAYGNNIEKIFTIQPNHDVDQIQMSFDGITEIKKDTDGSLLLSNDSKDIMSLRAPIAFQTIDGEKIFVDVEYEIIDNVSYGFLVNTYNKEYILVIDPIIQATYLGGSGNDYAYTIFTDSSGNVFLIADTTSTNFNGVTGGADATHNGSNDLLIAKLNSDLTTLIQSTYIGGSGNEEFAYGAVDNSGNVFIASRTTSTDFAGVTGGADATHNGSNDIVIAKFNNALTILTQSTYVGGSASDYAYGITIDGSNNIFVVGRTVSTDFAGVSGGADATHNGGVYDVVIAKLNNGLTTLTQSTYFGGSGADEGLGIARDGSNNIFVMGRTTSTDIPGLTGGADETHNGGGDDIVIAKFNNGLTTLIQSTYFGGSGDEDGGGGGIGIDSSDNIFVVTPTTSTDIPGLTGGADETHNGGGNDIVIAKFNNGLTTLTQSTYFGGSGSDGIPNGNRIIFDSSNNVYIAGDTASTDIPGTNGAIQPSNAGSNDIYIAKFNNSLTTLIQSTYFGGTLSEEELGGILISGDNLYLIFDGLSTDITGTSGGAQPNTAGSNEITIALLSNNLLLVNPSTVTASTSGGSSDNEHKSRPTFGIDEKSFAQKVDFGLTINDQSFAVDNNFWTEIPMQNLTVGEIQNFTSKVYATHQLNVMEFLFGIPEVGKWGEAEASVAITFDYAGEFEGITWNNHLQLLNQTSFSFSERDVFCGSDDTIEQCTQVSIELEFKESPIGKVLALQAIDHNRRSSILYFNDGITLQGESLNPPTIQQIISEIKYKGLQTIQRIDKENDIWMAMDKSEPVLLYQQNSFGTFIPLEYRTVEDVPNNITTFMGRDSSEFYRLIELEIRNAIIQFDSTLIQSQLGGSFIYDYPLEDRMGPLKDTIESEKIRAMDVYEKSYPDYEKTDYNFKE